MKKSNINSSSMKKLWKKPLCIVILLLFCLSPLLAEPCGDVNSDGAIDIVDALLISQYYVALNPENFDESAADVNGDGVEARQAWLDELEDEFAVDTSIDLSRLYTLVGSRESDILAP